MKRLLTLAVLFLCCAAISFAQFTGEVSDSQGVRYTANRDKTTCYVSGHESTYSATITIPEVYEGRRVTSIGYKAFSGCSELTSINIPDGVTSIGLYAFRGCSGLTSIIIPDGVTSIGGGAFSGCSSLTSINIPDGVTSIGDEAFYGCTGLTSINLPNGVTEIGERAFQGCSSLITINMPPNMTSIGGGAFSGCSSLTSINIPDGVTEIAQVAFYDCSSLTSIKIPDGVTSIGRFAFGYCSGLTSINIPDGVTEIGSCAFYDCSGLTSINIPKGVTEIGQQTFQYCSSLTSINLSDEVILIGNAAFSGCSSLTSINIPDGVTEIGEGAFSGCSSLTSINIPDGVTEIGHRAFQGCSGLTAINIPDGVTSIGGGAFSGCSSLTSINIPDGVTAIEGEVFYDCSGLTSIDIPDGVTSIGGSAFSGCSSLTSINIPDGVTEIGGSAFSGCSSLTSINIPDGVNEIGDGAFWGCSSLTSINIPDGVTSIGGGAFVGCRGITSINIPDGVTEIGGSAFSHCSSLTSINIPDGVNKIGDGAFSGCSGLELLIIPPSVTSIGDDAFRYCSSLSVVIVGWDNPLEINSNAFDSYHRPNLLYVPIGSKTAYEKADYWKDCHDIIEMKVWFNKYDGALSEQGVKYTANDDRFTCYVSGHEDVLGTDIIIPEYFMQRRVTAIGNNAFAGCSDLTSIFVKSKEPLGIDGSSFEGSIYQNTTLYVPLGCIDAYRAANVWKDFVNIKERVDNSDRQGVKYTANNDETTCYVSGYESTYNTIISIPYEYKGRRVTSIGEDAFVGCRRLMSVNFANGVTSIGKRAFYGCSGLTSVTIPASVEYIEYNAFQGCSGLTSIVVDKKNELYYSGNFNAIIFRGKELIVGCKNTIIPLGVTSIGPDAFNGCSGLTSVTIPSSVTEIGPDAFNGCSGLTSLTIPASVESIGVNAFAYCSGLTSIVVHKNNNYYHSYGNCNAIIRGTELIVGCKNTIIPSFVTWIGYNAFSGCGLTSVTIPASVTGIEPDAFRNCGLKKVIVSDIAAWCKITFYKHSSNPLIYAPLYSDENTEITDLVIPDGVTSIGDWAFFGCYRLTTITIPSSVTSIGGDAFSSCYGLTSVKVDWDTPLAFKHSPFDDVAKVTLYVPKGTKEVYEAAEVWKNFGTIIEYEKDNVLNEEDTTVPTSAIDVNVKVMRTINANEWSTICLPFAMTAEQVTAAFGDDVKIGDFDGYDTTEGDGDVVLAISMKFKQVTAMEANHPYVIKVSSKITEFSVDGVDLLPVENPVWAKTSGVMVGTYVAETVIPSGSMFLSGNKFWYSVGNSKMKAFRAYFHLNDVLPDLNGLEPAARVYLAFEDETTEIDATLIKSYEEAGNNGWHTLDGRKLAKMPTKKGVYVANGRKVVIK